MCNLESMFNNFIAGLTCIFQACGSFCEIFISCLAIWLRIYRLLHVVELVRNFFKQIQTFHIFMTLFFRKVI